MTDLMSQRHDGVVFARLDVVVDKCDECRVKTKNINSDLRIKKIKKVFYLDRKNILKRLQVDHISNGLNVECTLYM